MATRSGFAHQTHRSSRLLYPGRGAGEVSGFTFRRTRAILSSAIVTGIDQNIVACYCAIIANYEPGDHICLFGFSCGAYTVRSLANVLNLCGVPTKDRDGGPVPKYGPRLRKIAEDAVSMSTTTGPGRSAASTSTPRSFLQQVECSRTEKNALGAPCTSATTSLVYATHDNAKQCQKHRLALIGGRDKDSHIPS